MDTEVDPIGHIVYFAYVDVTGSSGENVFSRELVRALARQPGIRLSLIAPEPMHELPDDFRAPNVSLRFLPAKQRGSLWWSLRIQWTTLVQWLRAREDLGRTTGHVVTLRPGTLVPSLLSRVSRTPQVLVVEGLEARNVSRNASIPGASSVMSTIAWLNSVASTRVLVAYGAIRDWLGRMPLVDDSRLELFSHGVDPSLFPEWDLEEARRALELPVEPGDYVVGFVGSFKWYHSLEVLIGALARPEMSGVKALLVGDGPEREAITRLVQDHGIGDRVLQAGSVPHDQIAAYVGACNLMFGARAPEHWSNPIKLVEYLAGGRPVIGYRTEEAAFIEEHGLGVLLDEVTPESVSRAISTFRSAEAEEQVRVGVRARRHVFEHRTWGVLSRRVVQVLEGQGGG